MSTTQTVIAGITLPSTPLITAAMHLAKGSMEPWAYNHVMRSLLLGFAIADRVPDTATRDRELHALAAILHDLGWVERFSSADKCFEVDGADAARGWIGEQMKGEEGEGWDAHRMQLLWDAIALHTYPVVGLHKEPEVKATGLGIFADFVGPKGIPGGALLEAEWEGISRAFPRAGFKTGVVGKMCGFCRTKPETTYGNFARDFGVELVEGYSGEGKRAFDMIVNAVDAD